MSENPFNITRDEIVNLVSQKVYDDFNNDESISVSVSEIVKKRINDEVGAALKQKIDATLTLEIERLMSSEVVPVDIWGDRKGEPTTIRASLVEQARKFWNEMVNSEGKPCSSYGSRPRHEYIYAKICAEEFSASIKQNVVNIVGAFKDALVSDVTNKAAEHINTLIRVKTK